MKVEMVWLGYGLKYEWYEKGQDESRNDTSRVRMKVEMVWVGRDDSRNGMKVGRKQ